MHYKSAAASKKKREVLDVSGLFLCRVGLNVPKSYYV